RFAGDDSYVSRVVEAEGQPEQRGIAAIGARAVPIVRSEKPSLPRNEVAHRGEHQRFSARRIEHVPGLKNMRVVPPENVDAGIYEFFREGLARLRLARRVFGSPMEREHQKVDLAPDASDPFEKRLRLFPFCVKNRLDVRCRRRYVLVLRDGNETDLFTLE